MKTRYFVRWFSVDGAGTYPQPFESYTDAVSFADEKARYSNETIRDGRWINPWSYSYLVCDERSRTLYRPEYVRGYEVAA